MYATCLRCERAFDRNSELPHLPVGRRIAFDTSKGRLWVICRRCGQWNLVPIERRWEALEQCERLATAAEARVAGRAAGLARTASGLELLRVGGMPDADIANWRYGRRLRTRQRRMRGLLTALAALAVLTSVVIGVGAARLSGALVVGLYLGVAATWLLYRLWSRPPQLWVRVPDGRGGRRLLWPWHFQHVYLETADPRFTPTLVVPGRRGTLRLRGDAAAAALAVLLAKVNGADCADVSMTRVLAGVARAEAAATRRSRKLGRGARRRARARGQEPVAPPPLRPWEYLATHHVSGWLTDAEPVNRLALEMAVNEEVDAAALEAQADALAEVWREEDEIGAIADDLLLPDVVRERLAAVRQRRTSAHEDR